MERHINRERTSSSNIFYRDPGGVNACTPLQARQRRLWSAACPTLDCDPLHSVHIWLRCYHVVSFRLHTCSTWLPWRAVNLLFTNHNLTGCQSTWGYLERIKNPCHMLYNTCTRLFIFHLVLMPRENHKWICFPASFS